MNDIYQNYKNNAINTMTKGEQLNLLLDKAVQRINVSKLLMKDNNFEQASIQLKKTLDIFNYLIVCLDKSFEYSRELTELYNFINTQIIKASASKNIDCLDQILPIVEDLRDTWSQADKLSRTGK